VGRGKRSAVVADDELGWNRRPVSVRFLRLEMTRLTRCRFVLAQTVADSGDRLNDVRALGEFLAERAHDHVDDVAGDVGIVAPNIGEDPFAIHDGTRALHEVIEGIELTPRQRRAA
jgi:hypothetical protein